jgi:hypothetical protein
MRQVLYHHSSATGQNGRTHFNVERNKVIGGSSEKVKNEIMKVLNCFKYFCGVPKYIFLR